jgi:hypothetical protein
MPDIQINYLSLLAASVAGFFLSYVWYTPLFGKAWAKEMGFDPAHTPPPAAMAKSLLLTLLSMFLITMVLSNNIAVWTPSTWGIKGAEMGKASQAFQAAFFTWMGFFVSNLLQGVAWEKRSWRLFAIDAGYYLSLLLLVSFIVVYMR